MRGFPSDNIQYIERVIDQARVAERLLREANIQQRVLEQTRALDQLFEQARGLDQAKAAVRLLRHLDDAQALRRQIEVSRLHETAADQLYDRWGAISVLTNPPTDQAHSPALSASYAVTPEIESSEPGHCPLTAQDEELRYVIPLAYLLPRRAREEWIGDLEETRQDLIQQGYPWWVASLITFGTVLQLFWSLIRITHQEREGSLKKPSE